MPKTFESSETCNIFYLHLIEYKISLLKVNVSSKDPCLAIKFVVFLAIFRFFFA